MKVVAFMPKRILVLLTVAAMMALMMVLSEAALAKGDPCVSINGDYKVQKGSICFSDTTSQAVAVNSSNSLALNSSTAVAVNDSLALGLIDCTATAQNGDIDVCVF
jgi:uncharacterized protein (DUF2141 family)